MDGLQGVNRNCPMCGSGEWETGEIVSGTSVGDSGNALPMVQLVWKLRARDDVRRHAHRAGLVSPRRPKYAEVYAARTRVQAEAKEGRREPRARY